MSDNQDKINHKLEPNYIPQSLKDPPIQESCQDPAQMSTCNVISHMKKPLHERNTHMNIKY